MAAGQRREVIVTSPREQILSRIRSAHRRGSLVGANAQMLEERVRTHPRNLIPARTALPQSAQVDLFIKQAEEAAATVVRVEGWSGVIDAVAQYLREHNLPSTIRRSMDPELAALNWENNELLTVATGPAQNEDTASVTGAFVGVAETGTLMLHSGQQNPTTLNFLPENHIVVLPSARVTGSYEDAFDRLRDAYKSETSIPRTVNFITGPSRTGDIALTMEMGAHGPRRLHIILVDAKA